MSIPYPLTVTSNTTYQLSALTTPTISDATLESHGFEIPDWNLKDGCTWSSSVPRLIRRKLHRDGVH
jgi:hypothetical protein